MSCKGKNKIKNSYFNNKILNGNKSLLIETIDLQKNNYIIQLNVLGGIDIFDLNGNVIILDIETNDK
jgi:hypothetical protein